MKYQLKQFGRNFLMVLAVVVGIVVWMGGAVASLIVSDDHFVIGSLMGAVWLISTFAAFITIVESN